MKFYLKQGDLFLPKFLYTLKCLLTNAARLSLVTCWGKCPKLFTTVKVEERGARRNICIKKKHLNTRVDKKGSYKEQSFKCISKATFKNVTLGCWHCGKGH